jgi:hypothetical protein
MFSYLSHPISHKYDQSIFTWQFQDLLSQTGTSPLSQMDPSTSRSMDMLLPLGEGGRRRRAMDQDCSVSLRSYSERPRSHVSPPAKTLSLPVPHEVTEIQYVSLWCAWDNHVIKRAICCWGDLKQKLLCV